jgi:hypothetical protein
LERNREEDILALQEKPFVGAVVSMAQPNAEPVEEYEYVPPEIALSYTHLFYSLQPYRERKHTDIEISYEGLPPNFSLLQNMAAGAFAGIAVCASTLRSKNKEMKNARLIWRIGTYGYVSH